MMFEGGTTFLICSDGVTRHITDPEIRGMLTSGADPSQIVEQVRALCFERGAEDNLTAVLVKAADGSQQPERPDVHIAPVSEPPPSPAPFENKAIDASDEHEALEFETRELTRPDEETYSPAHPAPEPIVPINASPAERPSFNTEPVINLEPEPSIVPVFEHPTDPQIPAEAPLSQPEPALAVQAPSFDDHVSKSEEKKEKGAFGKIVSGVFLLLVGALVGLAGYHFILLPTIQRPAEPQITEMKTGNIPLTMFEENRRNVDKDPAGYISKVATSVKPQSDSTDYYLLGRAYILVGDYPKARAALIEARNRLAYTEPANVTVLTTDIAMALALTNEPTIQNILKKELDSTKPATNVAINGIVNSGNSNSLNGNIKTNANLPPR
jgi:hypothetical protein